MRINSLSPIIYVTNIEETIDFYDKILGFKCQNYDESKGWAILKLAQVEIMISKPNEKLYFEKPIFTGSFYFNIQNIDELWNEIKNNVSVCYPLEVFDYGMKEFAINDNNGYLLQFGQDLN